MTIRFKSIPGCPEQQPFAECQGVDLSQPLHSETWKGIGEGLLKHGLLVFRGQELSPENEVRFNEAFGWHDASQSEFLFGFGAPAAEHKVSGGAQIPDWPQVSVLGNVFLKDHYGIRNTQLVQQLGLRYSGWHADGLHDMFSGMPELTTMYSPQGWHTVGGGQTLFTSGVEALTRIPTDTVGELSHCTGAYVRCPNDELPDESRRIIPGPTYMVRDGTRRIGFAREIGNPEAGMHDFELLPEHADQGGRHPCIRTHPVTGQPSLYVTPGRVIYLLDSKTGKIRHGIEESADLLADALQPSVVDGVVYRHQWEEGDFVAWINTLVLHSASDPSDIEGDRLIHRVRLSTPKSP